MKSQKRKTEDSSDDEGDETADKLLKKMKRMKIEGYGDNYRNIVTMIVVNVREQDPEYTNNKGAMLVAIRERPQYLEFASDLLKDDKEVVSYAVSQQWGTLKFASNRLRKDKEVVRQAAKEDFRALEYADESLYNDEEFMLSLDIPRKFMYSYRIKKLLGRKLTIRMIRKLYLTTNPYDETTYYPYSTIDKCDDNFLYWAFDYFLTTSQEEGAGSVTSDEFFNILIDYENANFPDIPMIKRFAKSTFKNMRIGEDTMKKINDIINFKPTIFSKISSKKDNSSVKIDSKPIDKSFGNMGFSFK